MPQKKKTNNKKTNKKKHLNHNKQTIVYQSIPNYSSGQSSGHQINKDHVQFAPSVQQQTRTDNLVGDLVGKLISKIETDGNKQTQEYTKEIQPINNNNYVNVYKDGSTAETSSGSSSSSGSSDTTSKITNTVRDKAIDKGVDYGMAAIGGAVVAGVGAIGTPVKFAFARVLLVKVSVPANVAMVPVVGKITLVTPVLVNVVL